MALYELSDQQIKNLNIFLNRVDIKGSEAMSLVSVLQSLSTPFKLETKPEVSKEKKK